MENYEYEDINKNRIDEIKNYREKILNTKKELTKKEEFMTSKSSLVKYDTPFLILSSNTNKKTLEDLEINESYEQEYLRNIIYSNDIEQEKKQANIRNYSLRDALNKILRPKRYPEETDTDKSQNQIYVKYVSCSPVTKEDVNNLQEELDRQLQTKQARETGICEIREKLYMDCFDELIRQITLNCLERGILLKRIKNEIITTLDSYQNLYQSSIAYGIRSLLYAEKQKRQYIEKRDKLKDKCKELELLKEQLQIDYDNAVKQEQIDRIESEKKLIDDIAIKRQEAENKKNLLKDLLAIKA